MNTEAPPEKEQELSTQALTITQQAEMVNIIDQQSYNFAANLLTEGIKPWRKAWENYWDEVKKPMRAAMNAVQGKFRERDDVVASAEITVKAAIARWHVSQQVLQEERQRAAQAEAERQEREAREAAAIAAEIDGDLETAEVIQAAPVLAVAPPVEPTYQKASGITKRDNWKARVVNLKALAKAVASGKMPVDYILPNQSVLDARAKADKSLLQIPGVQPYNDPIISGKAK
jgi:hypothetical protein